VCYQPSKDYGPDYIDQIKACAGQFRLTVVEDTRWPGWWCKLAAFERGGNFLLADLDTIFVDTLPIPNRLTMLRDFYRPQRLQSGLMWVTADAAALAWRVFKHDPEGTMQRFRGDGEFLAWLFPHARTWQDDYPGKVVSYKVHCKGGPPDGAAVICYHGKPRPRDTGWSTTR